ncbi:hypothetical protein SPHINGO8AM_210017 [Sphingomonas sp. 8AM]|nr:hypothetical protein SPHINGO8AM_210017 [Sphingomonas sp. 8AM]
MLILSAQPSEAMVQVGEFRRARIVGDLPDVMRHRFLHQPEVFGRENRAAALRFGVRHDDCSFAGDAIIMP